MFRTLVLSFCLAAPFDFSLLSSPSYDVRITGMRALVRSDDLEAIQARAPKTSSERHLLLTASTQIRKARRDRALTELTRGKKSKIVGWNEWKLILGDTKENRRQYANVFAEYGQQLNRFFGGDSSVPLKMMNQVIAHQGIDNASDNWLSAVFLMLAVSGDHQTVKSIYDAAFDNWEWYGYDAGNGNLKKLMAHAGKDVAPESSP